jgi:hypothetical protein
VTSRRAARCAGLALLAGLASSGARAEIASYTSRAAFDAAIAGLETVAALDFESLAPTTTIPSGTQQGGFTFTYAIGGEQLVVIDAFATTSGSNSLGVTGELVFLASDIFSLAFAPATAIGLYVIGEDMLPGDVELLTAAGSVQNGAAETTLPDGSDVFFLGLVESDAGMPFSEAVVVSFAVEGVGDYVWNADDLVAAPEPDADGAMAAAAVALVALSRPAGVRRPARSAFRPGR